MNFLCSCVIFLSWNYYWKILIINMSSDLIHEYTKDFIARDTLWLYNFLKHHDKPLLDTMLIEIIGYQMWLILENIDL